MSEGRDYRQDAGDPQGDRIGKSDMRRQPGAGATGRFAIAMDAQPEA
ncbi:MAG: hypothetical protein E5299_02466 [Burkholderia gladioli]|nr:MAG: hypothetical protein E5299_02466 [Burkholderia gladioli]